MCPKCRWNQLSCPREPCRGLSSLPSPSLLPPLCSLPCHLPGSPSDLLQLLLCVPIFPAVPCTALPGSIPLAVLPALPPRGCPHLLALPLTLLGRASSPSGSLLRSKWQRPVPAQMAVRGWGPTGAGGCRAGWSTAGTAHPFGCVGQGALPVR